MAERECKTCGRPMAPNAFREIELTYGRRLTQCWSCEHCGTERWDPLPPERLVQPGLQVVLPPTGTG